MNITWKVIKFCVSLGIFLSYVMDVKGILIWLKEFQFGKNKLANFG